VESGLDPLPRLYRIPILTFPLDDNAPFVVWAQRQEKDPAPSLSGKQGASSFLFLQNDPLHDPFSQFAPSLSFSPAL